MYRTTGPYRGYFVAAYTVKTKNGYVGFGKACSSRPAEKPNVSGADVISSAYPSEHQALVAAEHKVRLEIEALPPNWEPFTAPGALNDR